METQSNRVKLAEYTKNPNSVEQSVPIRNMSRHGSGILIGLFGITCISGLLHTADTQMGSQLFAIDTDGQRRVWQTSKLRGNFERFLKLDEIYAYLERLEKSYKPLVSIENIGTTYEERPIKLVKISVPSPVSKPILWIDAGIHAREWISISTALFVINQLATGYDRDPTVHKMVTAFDWYIVPVVNPDGYNYSFFDRMWRKNRSPGPHPNCKGVDLNRNFDFFFGGPGSSNNACDETFQGRRALSEAETLAVYHTVLRLHGRMKVFISLHSFNQLWMVPFGTSRVRPKHFKQMVYMAKIATAAIKKLYGTHYNIGAISELSGYSGGSSVDWAYALGIPYTFAVELPDKGKYGFNLPPNHIIPIGQEIFIAMQHIAQLLT